LIDAGEGGGILEDPLWWYCYLLTVMRLMGGGVNDE